MQKNTWYWRGGSLLLLFVVTVVTMNSAVQDTRRREWRQTAVSQPQASGKEDPWRVQGSAEKNPTGDYPGEESKKDGWLSRISSSKLRNGPHQCAGNQAKVAQGLHGWRKSFWLNSNVRAGPRWSKGNTETLSHGHKSPTAVESGRDMQDNKKGFQTYREQDGRFTKGKPWLANIIAA